MNYHTPNEIFLIIYNFLSLVFIFLGIGCFVVATLFLLEPIRKRTDSKTLALSAVFAIWAIIFYLAEKGVL